MAGTPSNALNISGNGIVTSDLGAITTSSITQYGTLVAGANQTVTSLSPGTAGQVLVSNGPTENPSFQTVSATGITQIDGDSGSATGSTITIKAVRAIPNNQGTVTFQASASSVQLNCTDSAENTAYGQNTFILNPNTSLVYGNIVFGTNCLVSLNNTVQTSFNTAIGYGSLNSLTSGQNNTALGIYSGSNLTTGNNNICINSHGVNGDNSTLRIGDDPKLQKAFICGINGNTISSTNAKMVTIDSTTDQLGVANIPSGSGINAVNVQVFNSGSGTYTPTTGMQYCIIECVGGGGGGGGANGNNSTENSCGGGGGYGGYVKVLYTAAQVGSTATYQIGTGGTGGVGANPGNIGNPTTFTCSGTGSSISANGGYGGESITIADGTSFVIGGEGVAGSILQNPYQSPSGQYGFILATTDPLLISGAGANGIYGTGGGSIAITTTIVSAQAGLNALDGFGAGGGGAVSRTDSVDGGAGSGGVIIITEYIS